MAKYTNLRSLFAAIADAIRSKTGETSAIVADNFPDAIRAIETHEAEDAIIDGSIGRYSNDRVLRVSPYVFYERANLTEVRFANVTHVNSEAFGACYRLRTVYMPSAEYIGNGAFCGCRNLSEIYCPLVTCIHAVAFTGTNLKILDIYGGNIICHCAFEGSHYFRALILRSESSITAIESSTFDNSTIADGVAYVYVPAALVEQYKAAENWSNYANQIRALEDYTVDGTVTGKLDMTKI